MLVAWDDKANRETDIITTLVEPMPALRAAQVMAPADLSMPELDGLALLR